MNFGRDSGHFQLEGQEMFVTETGYRKYKPSLVNTK